MRKQAGEFYDKDTIDYYNYWHNWQGGILQQSVMVSKKQSARIAGFWQ
jgi:hypothetical protein